MGLHSKDRFKKVEITDIAIKKVQRISYKGLTEDQNDILYRLARLVLIRSKAENNSNEFAYTIDLAATVENTVTWASVTGVAGAALKLQESTAADGTFTNVAGATFTVTGGSSSTEITNGSTKVVATADLTRGKNRCCC